MADNPRMFPSNGASPGHESRGAHPLATDSATAAPATAIDTVRIPGMTSPDPVVVRPALAVMFRVALGPGADRYVPRFLDWERTGRARPRWNWSAFLAPPVWAFYRRLWIEGIAFALLPVAGVFAFAAFGGTLEAAGAAWWIALAAFVWLQPSVLAGLFADALLWGRTRRAVARAEAATRSATKAIEALAGGRPTSTWAAVVLGGGSVVLAAAALGPPIRAEYVAHAAREAVVRTLASVRGVQEAVEAARERTGTIADARSVGRLVAQNDGRYVEDVAVNAATGRVRVSLGPSVPGAAGKAILLAPTLDAADRVQWLCVPVDIPARYLPESCRR
ncbi:MAG: DUF2628 domain-containing protein [Burkholderiales bacterium]|jgi:hypothetical protein|nr:DUF2628 domain-containing protein [Burkholderiales bacterium]